MVAAILDDCDILWLLIWQEMLHFSEVNLTETLKRMFSSTNTDKEDFPELVTFENVNLS